MWKQRNKSDFVAPLHVKFFSECGNFRSGWSPLLLAASNGHLELVKIFLDVNARVDVFAAGNLNYALTEKCSIFQLYHNSNFPLQKYACVMPNVCRALRNEHSISPILWLGVVVFGMPSIGLCYWNAHSLPHSKN